MNQAFDNYLGLAVKLSEDFNQYLDTEIETENWRRNYIRVVVALVEGYSNCFREMAVIGLEVEHPELSKKEEKSLRTGFGFSANERLKYTLRATYKMFSLSPIPDFGGKDWEKVNDLIDKRHSLTHPKEPSDLDVTNEAWLQYRISANWIINCHFNVAKLLHEKYVQ